MAEPHSETDADPVLYAGVRALDHTADVGFDARARTLEELFHGAGRGLMALLRGEDRRVDGAAEPDEERRRPPDMTGEWRRLAVDADDVEALLVAWLRELLWLYESRRFAYQAVRFDTLDERSLVATIGGGTETRAPAREVKGVTYHELKVARDGAGWRARVIFDV